MQTNERPVSATSVMIGLLLLAATVIAGLERLRRQFLSSSHHLHGAAALALVTVLSSYLRVRAHVLSHWYIYGPVAVLGPALVMAALKKSAAAFHRYRERASGFAFENASYGLKRATFNLLPRIPDYDDLRRRVFLGLTEQAEPVFLTDRDRSMHVHVLGQTGSGKTKSVLEPLMLQDMVRDRGVLLVDGKGSLENHERFLALATAAGRFDDLRILTLIEGWPTHTYNILHLTPNADPKAVAQRAFSSFVDDMDNSYYRNQAGNFFEALVRALASTGKCFSMMDVAAAVATRDILAVALEQCSDLRAKREIETQLDQLGRKAGETFTGLLAALRRYDIPALNAYDPDIVLEEDIEAGRILAFFLPANLYKQLARYVGLVVFQHVQYVGALRQTRAATPGAPFYVYADEFYSFAYEGFTDALNKLRDAGISILLSHQTFSDLEKVSPEFADGVWDNTRNKIVLYQNHPETCERVAKTLGTRKMVELTVRRSADSFLNSYSTLEASSREVDAYRCHPNRLKNLECGQAYLGQDSQFVGVNLGTIPDTLLDRYRSLRPTPRKPAEVDGIRLHELFLEMEPRACAASLS